MKANEVPEKLYIDLFKGVFNVSYFPVDTSVEYIRKDAFIEKAAEWLRNYVNPIAGTYLFDEDIEKFINYMKGE